jgi:hypothetical protein
MLFVGAGVKDGLYYLSITCRSRKEYGSEQREVHSTKAYIINYGVPAELSTGSCSEKDCCFCHSKCLWAQFMLPEQNRPQCSSDMLYLVFTKRPELGVELQGLC